MFEKEELALIHKAIFELTIKGSEAHAVSQLLDKIVVLHTPPKPQPKSKLKSEK
jgi:hypothetical protein